MPKIIKKEPQPHVVILDTNILWHEDKRFAVNPDFNTFWQNQIKTFQLELVIPEVVKGELLFQQYTSALKTKQKITENMDKINAITGKKYKHRITDNAIKASIEAKFEKWLKSKDGKVETVPLKKIEWDQILNAAIWRLPPFEFDEKNKENEKGFRDALIIETVVEFCKHDTRNISIALICDDKLLRENAESRLSDDPRFSTYESLEEFGSYLRLTQEELTNQFIKSLMRKASDKFLTPGDANCLAVRSNLSEQLRAEYGKYFDEPSLSERLALMIPKSITESLWVASSAGRFWVGRAQFKELEGDNIYHWITVVTYSRLYERKQPSTSLLGLLPAMGTTEEKNIEKALFLPFHILWRAKVTSDARFHDMRIEKIELKDNIFKVLTTEERKAYGFPIKES